MTVTGVTESVTSVTVAVTITSRCRNTSHSAAPSRAPQHNRHGKPRKTAIPDTSEWGLSHPNHLRKPPTPNVDFHSQPSQNSKPANPKWGLSQPIGMVSGGRIELLQG